MEGLTLANILVVYGPLGVIAALSIYFNIHQYKQADKKAEKNDELVEKLAAQRQESEKVIQQLGEVVRAQGATLERFQGTIAEQARAINDNTREMFRGRSTGRSGGDYKAVDPEKRR